MDETNWHFHIFLTVTNHRSDVLLKKGKAIPVTGRGGPLVRDTSRLPHFLDNRHTD
jgi:hypothetical protein